MGGYVGHLRRVVLVWKNAGQQDTQQSILISMQMSKPEASKLEDEPDSKMDRSPQCCGMLPFITPEFHNYTILK